MQRRFSLELSLNINNHSNKIQQTLSQHKVGNLQAHEPKQLEFSTGKMIDEEEKMSFLSPNNYSAQELAEDLVKVMSIQERVQAPQKQLTFQATLSEDRIIEQMSDMKRQKKLTEKWNSKNSLETTHSISSQYGEEILSYESFRHSLAQIILEKVEE